MITFTRRKGRMGNRLFQYASMMGLSEKYGHELRLPKWEFADFMEWDIPEFKGGVTKQVIEPNYHYDPDFWDKQLSDKNAVIDICGWLQTEKYFGSKTPKFKEEYKTKIFEQHKQLFEKPTIAITIRRGDFVLNSNYYQLPITYYILALFEHFPNWRDCNLLFFSDDINYCKLHFQCLPNAYFPELNAIDQLCLGSQCENFIISNSTFSWWMAYLGNKNATVIRPKKNIDGELAKTHDEKDYWIDRWTIFNHENKKINLKDVTFTIPVSYDHNDRKQNLELSVCLLQKDFDTNIIIMEQGGDKFSYMGQWSKYVKTDSTDFHRTKMLNDMAGMATTPIIVNYDCDNVLAPMQLWMAAEKIRNGAHMVYPFDGQSARVPREYNFKKLEKYLDAGIFGSTGFKGMGKYDSVGHGVFFDKRAFIEGGMENENMISWAPEDTERFERFTRLGFKIERVKGAVYHLDHYTGVNSSKSNPHYQNNYKELERIREMNDEELKEYVNTWVWAHPYTESYYEGIIENAIRSSEEVFKVLPHEFNSVVDVGCGLGEWGVNLIKQGKKYYGIDYKIPRHKLLIPEYHFWELDLNDFCIGKISDNYRYDIAICLEVGEHLYEANAKFLVQTLCGFSDYVLFSAAIPGQGGLDHKNEQWQTWWEKLFNDNGFFASEEPFRDKIKDNKNIEIWYRNNIVLYSKHFKGKVEDYVHPEMFTQVIGHYQNQKTA